LPKFSVIFFQATHSLGRFLTTFLPRGPLTLHPPHVGCRCAADPVPAIKTFSLEAKEKAGVCE